MNRLFAGLLSLFIGLWLALPVSAGTNVWTQFGPEGGEAGRILSHPTNTNRIYAVGSGRIYRSDDAAATWRPIMNGLPDVRSEITIELSNANAEIVYALIRSETSNRFEAIYRTLNGGLRWKRLNYVRPAGSQFVDISVSHSDATRIIVATSNAGTTSVALSNDAGESFFGSSNFPSTAFTTTSVARHGNNAYAAFRGMAGGLGLFKSTDNGLNWLAVPSFPTAVTNIFRIRFSSNGALLYGNAETFGQICIDPCQRGFRYLTATGVFTTLNPYLFRSWISPTNSAIVLQPFLNSISSSADSATTFTQRLALTDGYFFDVAGHPSYPAVPSFYVASNTRGILKTVDDGATNTPANTGFYAKKVSALALVNSSATSYRLYEGEEQQFNSRGIALRLLSDINPPSVWASLPVDAVDSQGVPAIAIDPTTITRVYAGNTLGKLLRSSNSGVNWSSVSLAGLLSTHAVALDPRSCVPVPISGVCTAGPLTTVIVGGTEDSSVAFGANTRAIQVSDDGGLNFSSTVGIPRPANANYRLRITSISFNNQNTNNILAGSMLIGSGATGASTNGVFRSTNNGRSWAPSNSGLPTIPGGGTNSAYNVGVVTTVPSNGSIAYVGVFDDPLAPSTLSGLYKSTNGGVSWVRSGLAARAIRQILISPTDPNLIYVALSGTAGGPGGVVRSKDAGVTWRSISVGLPPPGAYALVARGNQLFAGTPTGVYDYFDGPDNDQDNVGDQVENDAPNGGDLNFDGILDSLQSQSSSYVIKTVNDGSPVQLPRGRTNYSNQETGGANREGAGQAGCDQLNNSYGIDPEIYPADVHASGIEYDASDLGLVNVELEDCSSAVITVRYDDGAFNDPLNWTWRNYGPTTPGDDASFGWYAFPGAQRVNSTTWKLTINANQLGTYRADPNSILLRGGPSFFPERLLTNGFE